MSGMADHGDTHTGRLNHLDEVSKAIIEQLQQDGRRAYAKIGQAVGLSEAAVRQRVQRLIDSGVMQPSTSFDAGLCLTEQGIGDSILIIEEVAWSADGTRAWLLVHGPVDRETLRANGGIISATVVLPTCGTGAHDEDPGQDRLWAGHVMIGPL